ncbi:MAG: metal ABC transporter permease [Candidatus Aureabacteria bacterium]|nr:metal ABC transporter permease [Candidatus Auribacterota bacterium]
MLEQEFFRNALLAGLFASVACGVMGSIVVSRRLASICGGIAHACFGGVGLGYLLHFNPSWGALLFAILSGLGIGTVSRRTRQAEDTSVAIFWAVGMSLGIIFIGLSKGYAPDLLTYLFGNILAVTRLDLLSLLVLDAVVIASLLLFYKEILALCFDEEFLEVRGVPVFPLYLFLLVLAALTVVVLMKVVGIILVIALLTLPAAIVAPFVKTLKGMMAAATLASLALILAGLVLSYLLDLPSGATVVLLAAAVYLLSRLFRRR